MMDNAAGLVMGWLGPKTSLHVGVSPGCTPPPPSPLETPVPTVGIVHTPVRLNLLENSLMGNTLGKSTV